MWRTVGFFVGSIIGVWILLFTLALALRAVLGAADLLFPGEKPQPIITVAADEPACAPQMPIMPKRPNFHPFGRKADTA